MRTVVPRVAVRAIPRRRRHSCHAGATEAADPPEQHEHPVPPPHRPPLRGRRGRRCRDGRRCRGRVHGIRRGEEAGSASSTSTAAEHGRAPARPRGDRPSGPATPASSTPQVLPTRRRSSRHERCSSRRPPSSSRRPTRPTSARGPRRRPTSASRCSSQEPGSPTSSTACGARTVVRCSAAADRDSPAASGAATAAAVADDRSASARCSRVPPSVASRPPRPAAHGAPHGAVLLVRDERAVPASLQPMLRAVGCGRRDRDGRRPAGAPRRLRRRCEPAGRRCSRSERGSARWTASPSGSAPRRSPTSCREAGCSLSRGAGWSRSTATPDGGAGHARRAVRPSGRRPRQGPGRRVRGPDRQCRRPGLRDHRLRGLPVGPEGRVLLATHAGRPAPAVGRGRGGRGRVRRPRPPARAHRLPHPGPAATRSCSAGRGSGSPSTRSGGCGRTRCTSADRVGRHRRGQPGRRLARRPGARARPAAEGAHPAPVPALDGPRARAARHLPRRDPVARARRRPGAAGRQAGDLAVAAARPARRGSGSAGRTSQDEDTPMLYTRSRRWLGSARPRGSCRTSSAVSR